MGTEVFTMDSSGFTSPPWAWSAQPDAGIVDIDYTCTIDAGAYCPSPSNGATQSRQILLADIGIAQPAGSGTIQYAQAYRDVYYNPPLIAGIPIIAPPPLPRAHHCFCDVVGGEDWSLAALGVTGLGAGALAGRRLRRRARSASRP
jgi:hypothetical protein